MTRSGNMQAEDRMQREAWGMQLYCNLMKRQNERDGDGEMRMRRATCLSSLGIRKCITMNDPASKSGIAITYTSRHVMSFMIKEQDADCRLSRSERSAFEPCGRWSSFRSLPNGRVFPRARLRVALLVGVTILSPRMVREWNLCIRGSTHSQLFASDRRSRAHATHTPSNSFPLLPALNSFDLEVTDIDTP
jgi:hypothetical protein